jgi:hypothetical protein
MCRSSSCEAHGYSGTREVRNVASRPLVPIVSHISPLHTLVVYCILILASHLLLGLPRIFISLGIIITEQKKVRVIKATGRWLQFWHEPNRTPILDDTNRAPKRYSYRIHWSRGNAVELFERRSGRISPGTPANLTEVYRDFPPSLQVKGKAIPVTGHGGP